MLEMGYLTWNMLNFVGMIGPGKDVMGCCDEQRSNGCCEVKDMKEARTKVQEEKD